jgi:hypothetical protein
MYHVEVCRVKVMFFIGQVNPSVQNQKETEEKITTEQSSFGDIVRLNFIENYFNLTRKTMNMVIWAKENGFNNVFKVDDDSFLRVDNLVAFMKSEKNIANIYAGYFV